MNTKTTNPDNAPETLKNLPGEHSVDRPVRTFVYLHGILGHQEPIGVWHTNDRRKLMRLYRSPFASVDAILAAMGLECLDWTKEEKERIGKMLGIPVANVHDDRQLPAASRPE